MVYNAGIPQPTDNISTVSQAQLLENFTQLNTQFSEDHVAFTATTGNGYHAKVTFNDVLGLDPGLSTPIASLYTKADAAGTSQLFFENDDITTGTNIVRQITNIPVNGGTTKYVTTPMGLIYQFGPVTINTTATTITFPLAFPNNVYSLLLTVGNSSTASQQAVFSNLTTTGFKGYGSTNGLLVYYFAIGD